jgi:hypothetical protein
MARMGSTAVPLRLIPGGAPGAPASAARRGPVARPPASPPPASRRQPTGSAPERVVDLGARRRAGHVGELRTLLDGIDELWSTLWRSYPGRERDVVELHLRFDAVRDATIAWAIGQLDVAPHDAIERQLEGAAVLGAPARDAGRWRALCRSLEVLEHRVAALDPARR